MKYDFDTVIDRRNTGSLKWNVPESQLPMWVADMDFLAAPEILEELQKRLSHGIFGYSVVPDEWYDAICGWWEGRHHFHMEKEWLVFCTGVVPALSSIVRKLTSVGENVLIQTPVYNVFFNSIVNNGRNILESPLYYDTERHIYTIDFADLEAKLSDPQTSLMILCNPHNPIGKIWDRETLAQIGSLAAKHHVLVVSDEIHCDLTDPGKEYVPFASVNEECRQNSITCIAPTKAFNLAGIQTAAVCVPNPVLRHKVWRGLNTDEVAEPNVFAVPAAIAAFTKGAGWLDALREYIYGNKQLVAAYLKEHLPQIALVPSEATYLLWLDCRAICGKGVAQGGSVEIDANNGKGKGAAQGWSIGADASNGNGKTAAQGRSVEISASPLQRFLRREAGLYVSRGEQYGKAGAPFLRLNIACPRSTLQEGLLRLSDGVERFQKARL